MQKMLAGFAIFLAILPMQAHAQTDKAQHPSTGDKPAAPVAPVAPKQADSPPLQPEHKQHIDTDVWVVKTPKKDGWDKATFWINVALAGVGFFGVAIGICTLLFVRGQVVEMRRQRILAGRTLLAIRKQAEIAANAQRSWIIPKSVSKPDLTGVWIMKVTCEFEVYGSSPVRVHESQFIFDFFPAIPVGKAGEVVPDLPEKPDYGKELITLSDSPEMGQVWAPGSPITVAPTVKGTIAGKEQLQALKDGRSVLCLYGFINYRDAFDKSKMRTTRFCYICGKKGVLQRDNEEYFVLGGPPEYNGTD